MEMKEHDCYLANWAWLKGRGNQHGISFFREVHPPNMNFATQNQVWTIEFSHECGSMLYDDWLGIHCVVILYSFYFKPGMVSDKKYSRNIFTIIFLCSFHKGITAKDESSCYLPKVLVLGQKLVLGKPPNAFLIGEVVPLQHQLLSAYLKIHANEIYNIYDKHMHLQPPFQNFYE